MRPRFLLISLVVMLAATVGRAQVGSTPVYQQPASPAPVYGQPPSGTQPGPTASAYTQPAPAAPAAPVYPPPAPSAPVYAQPAPAPPAPAYGQPAAAPVASPAPAPAAVAAPAAAPPAGYVAAPGYYAAPPPGAVVVAPAQPIYAVAPPGVYLAAPPPVVLTPAPPLPCYQWSAAVDVLFLSRTIGSGVFLGANYDNPAVHQPPNVPPDRLYADDTYFPLAAGLRAEVSRRFDNLTLSGTYWGLHNWSVSSTIYGDPYHDTVLLASPYLQLAGFNNSLGYTYSSQVHNVEANALFRLNGRNPYSEFHWLVGARYFYLADQFTLSAIDGAGVTTEQLRYQTTNNLIGPQTGLLFIHGWERFQWDIGLKLGLLANAYNQHGTDIATGFVPPGFTPVDAAHSGGGMSFMIEFSIGARFRITDHVSFRLAYQVYDFTNVALGPRQVGGWNRSGNIALDGLSLGLQATW